MTEQSLLDQTLERIRAVFWSDEARDNHWDIGRCIVETLATLSSDGKKDLLREVMDQDLPVARNLDELADPRTWDEWVAGSLRISLTLRLEQEVDIEAANLHRLEPDSDPGTDED